MWGTNRKELVKKKKSKKEDVTTLIKIGNAS